MQGIAAADPHTLGVSSSKDASGRKTDITLVFSSTASRPQEAVQDMIQASRKLRQALEVKLDGSGTIETEDNVVGNLAPHGSGQAEPEGYRAQSIIAVKLGQFGNLGTVIDTTIKAGASRLNTVTFGIADSDNLQNRAIAAATKDAESKAQAQASALGLKLGPLLKSTTAPFSPPMGIAVPQNATVAPAHIEGTVAVPVNLGQVSNIADVTLTYTTQ